MDEILVSGSTAFDTLMHYKGNFKKYFEENGILSGINISILSESYTKNLGGVGANIAYNLALLGENPVLLSSVGSDYSFEGIMENKVNLQYLHKQDNTFSSRAVIIADDSDNRFTVFHPGAMKYASMSKISYIQEDISCAIVSANHIPTMMEHIRDLHKKGTKIFADPAQQISQMSQGELQEFIKLSDYLIVNEYEFKDLQKISGVSQKVLEDELEVIIITHGSKGSTLIQNNNSTHFDAVFVEDIEDTTGAGDAYRAGILKAFAEKLDWKIGCQLGSLLASYCVIAPGPQNHHFSFGIIQEDMKKYFGVDMDLYNKRGC